MMEEVSQMPQPTFTGLSVPVVSAILYKKQRAKDLKQSSIFIGVETYIDKAYSQKRLTKPKIAGCTSETSLYQHTV